MSTAQVPEEFQGRIATGKDWREIVAWVGDLPPMPHVAGRAIRMVEDPDCTANNLGELLSSDTALAARVLKIANSAMFCRQREVSTLNQAVMLIGFKALKGVIVAATLRQMNKGYGDLERLIWENSMCSAMCATTICKKLRKRYAEEAFLLGLLHSLGQIVFLNQKSTASMYKQVLQLIESAQMEYAVAEEQVYGFAHPLIGALVAKKWNFSAETCQVILHYRDPLETDKPENELEEKTAIVQLADALTHAAGVGSPAGYPNQMERALDLAKYLGFGADAQTVLESIVEETQTSFNAERHIYE